MEEFFNVVLGDSLYFSLFLVFLLLVLLIPLIIKIYIVLKIKQIAKNSELIKQELQNFNSNYCQNNFHE